MANDQASYKDIRVLICEPLAEAGVALLEEYFTVTSGVGWSREELLARVHEYDVLIVRSATKVNAEMIQAATNLPALGTGLKWDWNPSAGTLAVVAAVNTTPTNMVSSLSPDGTTLTLSWPADHLGWRLLVQTNNLAAGISGNPADWGTVTGSSTTNLENITINPALPSEFYQMVYP